MKNTPEKKEIIELSMPINAAYVSAVRLTSSSIANRLGFDVDEIEDIKAAVSEACAFIIKKSDAAKSKLFKVTFTMDASFIEIKMDSCFRLAETTDDDDMSLLMVKALMDDLEVFSKTDSDVEIIMLKKHKENSLGI